CGLCINYIEFQISPALLEVHGVAAPSINVENDDPTYAKLSQPIHENLLTTYVQISNRKENKVDKILHELLRNGDWARRYMQGSRSKKIDEWIHLDNCVQGVSTGSPVRALKIHSKSSKKHMSMKQHTKLGSFDLPPEHRRFDHFRPLHEMWKDYIIQFLKTCRKDQLAQCLLDADLRGAIISVSECKITSLTGVSGIMIRETAETLGIITQDNKFKVVPKKVSAFIFQVDCWKITLKGNKTYDSYHISKLDRSETIWTTK
ncbi:ribonuclease MRP protein subunit POP4, partial [Ziziphus jujuba]|uniref:Ribonuclease P protein subunit p29 n=1 Tax=Ziziphus jujuba TaxID=326968 RepID=A0ABM3IAW8_ZIZJJ